MDAEDDAADIVNFFSKRGFTTRIGYGDGTTFQGPNLPRALDKAAFLRATVGLPRAVTYVYTLNHDDTMHSFISGGVDGIIPDAFAHLNQWTRRSSRSWPPVVSQHPEVRLATRADNPFEPALQLYGVRITTSDDLFSGTDADITFTVKGCRGSASITIDTGDILLLYDSGRMRDGNTDWTTIPSVNFGKLSSITIFNDGTGDAPGWKMVDVAVGSARFLGPDFSNAVEYRAHLDDFIDGGQTVTLGLTPNFAEPRPTIQCPAPITVANAPGQCSTAVAFSPAVDGMCPDVTAVSSPPSGSTFPVATTTVTSFADSPSTGQSDPCTFTVTVQDTETPTITCPAPIVVDAVSPQGAAVEFAPSAFDNCAVSTLTSAPPSGTVFAIGTTTVTSVTTDPAGNVASCSFTIHMKIAAEQTADLVSAVEALDVEPGIRNALLAKLKAVLAALTALHINAACGELMAFLHLVEAQTDKEIIASDANTLLQAATRIRAVIDC